MSFDGLRVLSLESRRAKEMESLIMRHGGVPFVAASVKERAFEDHLVALRFIEQLESGEFDMVICMTGVGLTFLKELVAAHISVGRLAGALRRATILSRGPKPLVVLRSLDVNVDLVIPEPNTWKEIVQAVALRSERRIAVQEYGRPNQELNEALAGLGAAVTPISLYRWELPDDKEPLREAVRRLGSQQVDVVLFTSSIQLDHLFEVARELDAEAAVRHALANEVVIASVGPVMTTTLEAYGFPPHIVPVHPKMGSLVKAAAEQSAAYWRGTALQQPAQFSRISS
jgi:uroporphyrinogen-III synthase